MNMCGQISRGIGHNCPSSIIQLAAAEAVDETSDLSVYEKNMNILYELKGINNSILMIGGEEEENIKTTIENYKYYNAAIEDVYIPETKHLPQLEAPDAVLEQINMFL